jgi:hypothetical protein
LVNPFSPGTGMPVLLGHRHAAAQTLPAARSSDTAPDEEVFQLRRRRRARTVTVRPSVDTLLLDDASSSVDLSAQCILRPPRVILTTAEGAHSLCMLHDCEGRLQFVLAGLPAGPPLPQKECCAICLEPFQTGERVQLMANCQHVFHASCIRSLLQSQFARYSAADFGVPCPLCRSPLLAASISEIPQRERLPAVILDATWLNAESSDVDTGHQCAVDVVRGNCAVQGSRAALRRALTGPVNEYRRKGCELPRRSASVPLHTLREGSDELR